MCTYNVLNFCTWQIIVCMAFIPAFRDHGDLYIFSSIPIRLTVQSRHQCHKTFKCIMKLHCIQVHDIHACMCTCRASIHTQNSS